MISLFSSVVLLMSFHSGMHAVWLEALQHAHVNIHLDLPNAFVQVRQSLPLGGAGL